MQSTHVLIRWGQQEGQHWAWLTTPTTITLTQQGMQYSISHMPHVGGIAMVVKDWELGEHQLK